MGKSNRPRISEASRLLEERLGAHDEFDRRRRERDERRRRRLRLLTFGLLGRAWSAVLSND